MKKTVLLFVAFWSFFIAKAQVPEGYYDDAQGLSGEPLRTALHNIIKDHVEYSYNDLRDFLLKESDEDPDNSNNVIVIYSGRSYPKGNFGGGANDWNREHVWAKSHGDFGTRRPAGSDAHHIRPCDASVNSSRGNKDFDNGGEPHHEAIGCFADSDSWEPRDEVKGDVARMIFYMAVRYKGDFDEPDLEVHDQVDNGKTPFHGKLSALLEWNEQDPPSEFEKKRNEVVFQYQENRNPFIDHPEWVNQIFGPNASVGDDLNPLKPNFNFNNSTGYLSVDLSSFSSKETVNAELCDIKGNRISEIYCKSGQQNVIPLVNTSTGVYIVRLQLGNQVYSYKFLR